MGLAIQEKSCLAPADCVRPEEDPKGFLGQHVESSPRYLAFLFIYCYSNNISMLGIMDPCFFQREKKKLKKSFLKNE